MRQQLALLPGYLTAHLELVLVALLLGTAVSIPLGIWTAQRPRAERLVLGVASVIQTIPSLALLAVMVPTLAALGALTTATLGVELASIGYPPALIGLTLYSVLPMLRNTVAGIAGVDPTLVEAARGVGMSRSQQLRMVQLPLALPVIVAGMRTAAVWVVGMATLSTPVGATSLGNYIFSGLQTRNLSAVLVGCVAAAVLALVLDTLIHVLEVGARERRRPLVVGALVTLLALYAYAGASLARAWADRASPPVTIGAKTFTEQYVLSELLARQITRATGIETRIVPSLGSTVAFDALRSGGIDAYVDYSGTIWATVMGRRTVPHDRRRVLDEVGRYLERVHHLRMVGALGFENAYALAMRGTRARALGVGSVSTLAPRAPSLTIGGDYEFFARPEWQALRARYGLDFREQRSMDPSLMYQAVAGGEVDVISAFSTDGRVAAFDLVILDDDRHAIPPYDAIILTGAHLARERPAVMAALERLVGRIDAASMRRMNAAVDAGGKSPAAVAAAFLDGLAVSGHR